MKIKYIIHAVTLALFICSCGSSYKQNPSVRRPYTPSSAPQKAHQVKLPDAPEPKPQGPTQTSPNYLIHIVQKGETLMTLYTNKDLDVNELERWVFSSIEWGLTQTKPQQLVSHIVDKNGPRAYS